MNEASPKMDIYQKINVGNGLCAVPDRIFLDILPYK